MEADNTNHDPNRIPRLFASKIEQIISKACARHPSESSESIHLSSRVSDPRICVVCISE